MRFLGWMGLVLAATALVNCNCGAGPKKNVDSGTPVDSGTSSVPLTSCGGLDAGALGPGQVRFCSIDPYYAGLADGGVLSLDGGFPGGVSRIWYIWQGTDAGTAPLTVRFSGPDPVGQVISGIPDGGYWISDFAGQYWVYSTGRNVDLGYASLGRPQGAMASLGTSVTAGLQNGDLSGASPNYYLSSVSTQWDELGTPQFPDGGSMFFTPSTGIALDFSQGDLLFLEQMVSAGATPFRVASRAAMVSPFSFVNGGSNNITVNLDSAPTVSLDGTIDFTSAQPMAAGDSGFPVAQGSAWVAVDALPSGIQPTTGTTQAGSWVEPGIELASGSVPTNAPLTLSGVTAVNPAPASYVPVVASQMNLGATIPLPDSGTMVDYVSFKRAQVLSSALGSSSATFGLVLSPPRALTLDGMDATAALSGLGPSPILAWQPPAMGTPVAYRILVENLASLWPPVLIIWVPASVTQVQVPAFSASPVSFHVAAVGATDLDLSAHPWKLGLMTSLSEAITAAYTP